MDDMGAALHELHVAGCGVSMLPISDGVHEPVTELFAGSQQTGLDKAHHTVVYKNSKCYNL